MTTRTVKVYYDGDIRRAPLNTQATFEDLRSLIGRLFGSNVSKAAKITYEDEDGDKILVMTDVEVKDAIDNAKSRGKTLKLYVEVGKPTHAKISTSEQKDSPVKLSSEAEAFSQNVTPSRKDSFSQCDFEIFPSAPEAEDVEKVDEPKEEEAKGSPLYPSLKDEDEETAQPSTKEDKTSDKELKREDKIRQKQRKKEGRARFKKERARSKYEHKQGGCHGRRWRHQWNNQRQKARDELCEEINNFLDDEKIITALQEALPLTADLLVKGEGLKTVLDKVMETQPDLKNHILIQRILPIVNAFIGIVPSGVVGPILLDVVLELQQLFKGGKPEIPIRCLIKRVLKTMKHSARQETPKVHHGIYCDKCGENSGPICGNRWKKNGEDYDLCDKHYAELEEEEKKEYSNVELYGWQPPCAFGISGFHPGAFMNMFRGCGPFNPGFNRFHPSHRGPWAQRHRGPWGQPSRGPWGQPPRGPWGQPPRGPWERRGPYSNPHFRGRWNRHQ